MNTPSIRHSWYSWTLFSLVAALASTSALAVDKQAIAQANARYQQERAACLKGATNQDRSTCLTEAGAAYNQAKREGFPDTSAQNAANQRQRCERLPEADRTDCVARMQGKGTTTGTAAGGGIYRELVTREVGAPVVVEPGASAPAVK